MRGAVTLGGFVGGGPSLIARFDTGLEDDAYFVECRLPYVRVGRVAVDIIVGCGDACEESSQRRG